MTKTNTELAIEGLRHSTDEVIRLRARVVELEGLWRLSEGVRGVETIKCPLVEGVEPQYGVGRYAASAKVAEMYQTTYGDLIPGLLGLWKAVEGQRESDKTLSTKRLSLPVTYWMNKLDRLTEKSVNSAPNATILGQEDETLRVKTSRDGKFQVELFRVEIPGGQSYKMTIKVAEHVVATHVYQDREEAHREFVMYGLRGIELVELEEILECNDTGTALGNEDRSLWSSDIKFPLSGE